MISRNYRAVQEQWRPAKEQRPDQRSSKIFKDIHAWVRSRPEFAGIDPDEPDLLNAVSYVRQTRERGASAKRVLMVRAQLIMGRQDQ